MTWHVSLRLRLAEGGPVDVTALVPADAIITGYEIQVDGMPLVSQPFAIHEDARRYHTVCSRVGPDIEEADL